MVPFDGQLTRVELQSDTFDKNALEVGKEFEFNAPLKSFSRSILSSRQFITDYDKFKGKDLVIFRTPTGTEQFNITQWENENASEMESLVAPLRWKIDNITDVSDDIKYTPLEHTGRVMLVDISEVK